MIVLGTAASFTLRGTATPTLSWKSTRARRGALRSETMTWWILVRCSGLRLTDTLVVLLVVVPAVPPLFWVEPGPVAWLGWFDWLVVPALSWVALDGDWVVVSDLVVSLLVVSLLVVSLLVVSLLVVVLLSPDGADGA